MFLESVKLLNFRNFKSFNLFFNKKNTIIYGMNGVGKTSLIESVYLCSQGNSFRFATTPDLILKGNDNSVVKNIFSDKNKTYELEVLLNRFSKTKKIILNSKPISKTQLKKYNPIILFSPDSLQILKESAGYRRNVIDEFARLVHEDFDINLQKYRKILKQRNSLLRSCASEKIPPNEALSIKTKIDKQMFIPCSQKITKGRIRLLKELLPFMKEKSEIFSLNGKNLNLSYTISGEESLHLNEEQIDFLVAQQVKKRQIAELALGSTLSGPGKHQIEFFIEESNARSYCSQGQQRALVLSLCLAQILYFHSKIGYYPMLLLDDILSEFDSEKQNRFLDFLSNWECQTLLTTTNVKNSKWADWNYCHLEFKKDSDLLCQI